MTRFVLFGIGAIAAFALSCQVLPGAGTTTLVQQADPLADLPPVAAAPPKVPLAETIGFLEGRSSIASFHDVRDPVVRNVAEHLSLRHTGLSRREIRAVARTIVEECEARDVDITLVLAVIQVESAGYHRAVSSVGALGMMQIMPATGEQLARELGVDWHGPATLFDPVINVRFGIAYLSQLSDRYDHVPTALAAYNWGPGKIDRRIRRGVAMPQIYIQQVQKALERVEATGLGDRASS